MATLQFKYGTMGSSKTAKLIITNYSYNEKGLKTIILTSSIDTRSGMNLVKSRIDNLEAKAHSISDTDDIFSFIKGKLEHEDIDLILIDEVSFFTPKHIMQLVRIVDELDINIIAFGLLTDFKGNLFKASKKLIEYADKVSEIENICKCGNKTRFNARIVDGKIVRTGGVIQIGGNESYEPLCRKCFTKR